MATELLTNGTFDTALTGWTSTEAEAAIPGIGPAADGDVAWTSGQSGSARVQTAGSQNQAYDGALYQDIGGVTSGQTIRLLVTLWRRYQGTLTAASKLTGTVWLQRLTGGVFVPKPMVIVRTANWVPPRYVPSPIDIIQEMTAANVFDVTTYDYDVSHFFDHAANWRIWLSANVETGAIAAPRAQTFFGSVSLMDYGAPGTDVAELPTTSRDLFVSSQQAATLWTP